MDEYNVRSVVTKSIILFAVDILLFLTNIYFGIYFVKDQKDLALGVVGLVILLKTFTKLVDSIKSHSFSGLHTCNIGSIMYVKDEVIQLVALIAGIFLLTDIYDRRVFDVYSMVLIYIMLRATISYSMRLLVRKIAEDIITDLGKYTNN